jgi:hypothetical protein
MISARELVPRDRTDFERLEQLLKLPPHEVDACIGDLLIWLQDINYPVARPISDYLLGRGEVVVPHVKAILRGTNDRVWQYEVIVSLVDRWPRELVAALQPELEWLAYLNLLDAGEVDVRALRLLAQHNLGSRERNERALNQKRYSATAILGELSEIETFLKSDG